MNPLRPYERIDTLKQFLEHDGHVLRFYCVWDDPESLFHDPRELVLHYYLSDDTIDIKEVIPVNSGRDVVPLFLRRDKLPKVRNGKFILFEILLLIKNITCIVLRPAPGNLLRGYGLDNLRVSSNVYDFDAVEILPCNCNDI